MRVLVVEVDEPGPKILRFLRQAQLPAPMSFVERSRRRRIAQSRRMRAEQNALRADFDASLECARAIKGVQRQRMGRREKRRLGIIRQGLRKASVRCAVSSVSSRSESFGEVSVSSSSTKARRRRGRVAIRSFRVPCHPANHLAAFADPASGRSRSGSGGRLVLRTHKPALDLQCAGMVDADENSGAGDVGRIIDRGTLVEGRDLLLEFGEPLVDLLGQIVSAFVFLRERIILRERGFVTCLLLV